MNMRAQIVMTWTQTLIRCDEIWYDGVDQNCDGLNDYDQDGDRYEVLQTAETIVTIPILLRFLSTMVDRGL